MFKQEPGCYTWFKNDYHIYLPLRGFIDLLLMVCKLYGDPWEIIFGQELIPLRFKKEFIMDPVPFNKSSWTTMTLDFILPVAGNVTKPYPYRSSPVLVLLCSEEGKWTKMLFKKFVTSQSFSNLTRFILHERWQWYVASFWWWGCKITPYIGRAGK